MGDLSDVLFPFGDELNHVEGQFGQVVEGVRKLLKFGLAHLAFKSFLGHFQFVALGSVFLSLPFPPLVEQPLLSSMQVLVDIIDS